jgi:hypothetical protein
MAFGLIKIAETFSNVSNLLGSCKRSIDEIQAMFKPGASSSWSTRQEEVKNLRSEVAQFAAQTYPLIGNISRDLRRCLNVSKRQLEALSRNLDTTSKENVLSVIEHIKAGFCELIDRHDQLRTQAVGMKGGVDDLKGKVDRDKPPVGEPILKVFGVGACAVTIVGTVEQLLPVQFRTLLRVAAGLITFLMAFCEGKKWLDKLKARVQEMERNFSEMNQAINGLKIAIENSGGPLSGEDGAVDATQSLHTLSLSYSRMADRAEDGGLSIFRQEMRGELGSAIQKLTDALAVFERQTPQPQ